MKKWYAWVINWETGKGLEIGAWSLDALKSDLDEMHKTGFVNLDKCSVRFYSVEC